MRHGDNLADVLPVSTQSVVDANALTIIAPHAATQVVLSTYAPGVFSYPNSRMKPLLDTILPAMVTWT